MKEVSDKIWVTLPVTGGFVNVSYTSTSMRVTESFNLKLWGIFVLIVAGFVDIVIPPGNWPIQGHSY
jgi:hypothetical protein